jgi:site-specific recombinase XerD
VALFDHADDEVERIGASGRKGWQAAYRDAVMMKIAYGYGLRFNEVRRLQQSISRATLTPASSAHLVSARSDSARREARLPAQAPQRSDRVAMEARHLRALARERPRST